ncbi:hypothetical protein ACLPJK_25975 [Pseudomonas aeruginosa]|uniref:hypothetical protein n=1 Tax=Pseudomonas aeruginosa TaxID=287 RepID=UPI003D2D04CA
MAGFAQTVFSGKGDDSLVTGDVYALSPNEQLNNVFASAVDVLKGFGEDLLDTRSGVLRNVADILSRGPGRYSRENILDRVYSVLGPSGRQSIDKLGGTLGQTLFDTLGVPKQMSSKLMVEIGNITRTVENTRDYGYNMDYLGVLQQVLGNETVFKAMDLEAEAALISTAINGAMELGLPEVLDMVRDRSSNEYSWKKAYWNSTPEIVYSANLTAIDTLVENTSGDAVLGRAPDSVATILSNFSLERETTPDQYPTKAQALIATLSKIDANWDTYRRSASSSVINFGIFSDISADAKTVLSTVDKYQVAVLMAGQYSSVPIAQAVESLLNGTIL